MLDNPQHQPSFDQFSYSPKQWAKITGEHVSTTYRKINNSRIPAKQTPTGIKILREDGLRSLRELPDVVPMQGSADASDGREQRITRMEVAAAAAEASVRARRARAARVGDVERTSQTVELEERRCVIGNAFDRFGIDHLSVSSISLFAAAPGIWVMQRLLGRSIPVGACAHRGSAVEAGIIAILSGASHEDGIHITKAKFSELTAFSTDPRKEKERAALADISSRTGCLVAGSVGKARPDAVREVFGLSMVWGFRSLATPISNMTPTDLIIDIKTSFALPNQIRTKHARQVASYVGAANVAGAIAYVTNRKATMLACRRCAGPHRSPFPPGSQSCSASFDLGRPA